MLRNKFLVPFKKLNCPSQQVNIYGTGEKFIPSIRGIKEVEWLSNLDTFVSSVQ